MNKRNWEDLEGAGFFLVLVAASISMLLLCITAIIAVLKGIV